MFLSQLKIIIRNFIHKPLYPAISIVVLSTGIACVLLTSVWIRDELSYDSSFNNSDKLYRLTIEKNDQTTGYHTHIARSWYEWMKNIKNDIPGVKDFGRFIGRGEITIKIDSSVFNSRVLKANEDFIRIFSIRFIEGNPSAALKEPNTAIISKSAATKYFGTKNPVGEIIQDYLMNSRERKEYRITAIVEDLPVNSHFHFDFVLASDKSDLTEWTWYYNYILLDDNVNPSQIIGQFNQFAEKYIKPDEAKTLTPHLQKITDIHLESSKDRELEENGNKKILFLLGALALFVFFVSILNFINLQYVVFLRKHKAIAVLNYAGAGFYNHLASQFLQSFIYSLLSAMTGIFIFESLHSSFNILLGKSPDAGHELIHTTLWFLVPVIILIISLAGLYPLLVTQAKKKVSSITSKHADSYGNPQIRGNRYRILKSLITVQYIFSITLLITVIVANRQVRFIMNHRLGNNQNNIICVKGLPVQVYNKYQVFKSELLTNPDIKDVTSSFENPSSENLDMMSFEAPGVELKEKMLYVYPVDDNFFDFYQIDLVAGRNFREFAGNDTIHEDYILNECALKYLGWKAEDAIGKPFTLRFENEKNNIFSGGTIVGIVKDFQMSSMKNKIKPYVFFQKSFWLFSAQIKYDSAHLSGVLDKIETTWKDLYHDYPLEYDYVEDLYKQIYKNEMQLKNLSFALGIIGMFLSCLGLWGITGIIYEARTKEIGIRKINGAKTIQIITWLLKDIILIVSVALLFAIPLSYYLMDQWLNNFAYRTSLNWWIFYIGRNNCLPHSYIDS
ncbi:MAG: ABC transporter permease [Bacteroidales bacterium]|nr:ABC transporter permease [Bacteroidales bacterium]